MASPKVFPPELLLIGVLSSPRADDEEELLRSLSAAFGPILRAGPELPFPWSDYYDEEMGGRPRRSFLVATRLIDPSTLAAAKARTNGIESRFAVEGGRRYNLDPGLLSLGRFILATTKDRPQRIPLGAGIYGELTLIYDRGEYRALPWTYPDWASVEYRDFLAKLRANLKLRLRNLKREVDPRA